MEVLFHSFLTLALDGSEWSASHDCFSPWGGAHNSSERSSYKKNVLLFLGVESRILGSPARSFVCLLTALSPHRLVRHKLRLKLLLNYGRRIVLFLCSLWVWNSVFHCNGRTLAVGDWDQGAGYIRHEVIKWRKFYNKELQIQNSGHLVLNCSLACITSRTIMYNSVLYRGLSCCIPKLLSPSSFVAPRGSRSIS
jgi:hypothetical protein